MQLWQFQRKIHTSWLIAGASIGVIIGAVIVPHIEQSLFGSNVWLLLAVVAASVVFWKKSVYLVPIIVIAGIILGLWRGSLLGTQLEVYKSMIGQRVNLTGKVVDDPDIGKKGEMLLRLNSIQTGRASIGGRVWVSIAKNDDIKRGDIVAIEGLASKGFGNFPIAVYKADLLKVMRPEPGDVARVVRDWFADQIRLGIAEPQASLGLGYLLGQRRALPPELADALVITGLTHVVVASGYNLTILVRLARRLFVKTSKYLAALSASAMIISFMAVTGASPSMSRAGLVAGLSLAAWYYGRRFHPLILLPFAAAMTVLIDPSYAWNDLGWQLSFAAFAGVMILAPLLQRYFFGEKEPGTIRQIFGETVSATIMTLPILVLVFGQFSNVAIIANLLVLPLVPLAMLLTFIVGVGAMIVPGLAVIIAAPAQWLLTYMTSVVEFFARLTWAQTTVSVQPWMVWVSYIIIISICIYLWRVTKYDLSSKNLIE